MLNTITAFIFKVNRTCDLDSIIRSFCYIGSPAKWSVHGPVCCCSTQFELAVDTVFNGSDCQRHQWIKDDLFVLVKFLNSSQQVKYASINSAVQN